MLVSAPDHPNITPPAVPGPRRDGWIRRRLRAAFAVVITVFLAVVMSFMVAAPPAVALVPFAAPIAATAVRLAPSTIKALAPAAGAAVRSPLSGWLSGGLAIGFGALAPVGAGLFGVPMPWDVKTDAVTSDTDVNHQPRGTTNAHVTITGYNWETIEYASIDMVTLRIEGTCVRGRFNACPSADTDAWRPNSVSAVAKCFDPAGPSFYEDVMSATINGRQRHLSGRPPCVVGSGETSVQHPVASIELVQTGPINSSAPEIMNPEVVVNPDFDPGAVINADDVTVTVEAICHNPDNGNRITVREVSYGLDLLPMVDCPDGMTPERVGWTSSIGDEVKDLGGYTTDFTMYPECANGSCRLRVLVDDIPCTVGRPECYDWIHTNPPSRVKCEYGPYAVGLAECGDLQRIYRTTPGGTIDPDMPTQPQPAPNPDGTPTPTPTRIVPSDPEGRPVGDVVPDGYPRPDPFPPGQPNPDPNPPGQPDPTPPGGPPTSGPNPPPPGDIPRDPDTGQNCIAGMWSWNPVDWVYIPVKCALIWAFIPGDRGEGLIDMAKHEFGDNGLAEWLDVPPQIYAGIENAAGGGGAVQGMQTMNANYAPTASGSCSGPTISMPEMLGGEQYQPLNACEDPMAKYATMSRSLIIIVVTVGGMMSIINSLSLAFVGYRMFERQLDDHRTTQEVTRT